MNQIGATLRTLRPMKIVDIKDLLPALEVGRPAMLNETTKKPIVTDVALSELAHT